MEVSGSVSFPPPKILTNMALPEYFSTLRFHLSGVPLTNQQLLMEEWNQIQLSSSALSHAGACNAADNILKLKIQICLALSSDQIALQTMPKPNLHSAGTHKGLHKPL